MSADEPGVVTLRAPRSDGMMVLVVLCGLFVVMLYCAQLHPRFYFLAFFCVLVFAFMSVRTLPGATYLRLTPTKMVICECYWKTIIYWAEVQQFVMVQQTARLGIVLRDEPGVGGWMQSLQDAVQGCDVPIPSNFGLKQEELLLLLNTCLECYRESRQPKADQP